MLIMNLIPNEIFYIHHRITDNFLNSGTMIH
jgi:hypothetical protein